MPVYEKQGQVLHASGKLMAVHMDGRLNSLKHLIPQTPIDIIEAFHTPPMGDLPLAEALSLWADKCIWVGFPAAVYELGPQATREHALEILHEALVSQGYRLAVAMSTENIVSNQNLLAVTSVLEKAELPLRRDAIARIAEEGMLA